MPQKYPDKRGPEKRENAWFAKRVFIPVLECVGRGSRRFRAEKLHRFHTEICVLRCNAKVLLNGNQVQLSEDQVSLSEDLVSLSEVLPMVEQVFWK